MLKAFRQNSLLQAIVTLLVTALLWVRAFIAPPVMEVERYFSPLYGLVQGLLSGMPRVAVALALVLVLLEGVWLNIILSNNKMSSVNWLMPTLMFMLAMSWDASQLTVTPMLLSWIALLGAIAQLLTSGNTSLEVDRNFNASFLVGVAAMCYMPAITFTIPYLLLFVSYKSYQWRDIIVAILGFLAPFFLLVVFAFMTDKLEYYFILFRHDIVNLKPSFDTSGIPKVIANLLFIIILLWALFTQLITMNDSTIQQRINRTIMFLLLVATLLMLPYDTIFTINTQTAALPFAFLTSNLLATDRKRQWISDLAFLLIIITPLIASIF